MNLGGFSNISFVANKQRVAFDISAVNTILNHYASTLGFDYDDKGAIARNGNCHDELLTELNALPFYQLPYPKSLGFEFVKVIALPLMEHFTIPIQDKLNTFTQHIAQQIAAALPEKKGKMLITGGGTYNTFLIEKIKENVPEMEIIIPDAKTIEFKEALIFGLLGVLKLRNEVNVLSSVTGAKTDHSSGVVHKINSQQ